MISRKEKLRKECLVAKEEKVVIRGENQKREYNSMCATRFIVQFIFFQFHKISLVVFFCKIFL